MLKKEDFVQLTKAFEQASTEQLIVLQKYLEATVNERINIAAANSGLIKEEEETK
jgi:hypothetical protein